MSLEKILTALMSFGLTQLEAEIYVFLSKYGPKSENQIADQMAISKAKLSIALIHLQKTSYIIRNEQTLLLAVPLQDILDNVIEMRLNEAKRIENEKQHNY